MEQLLDLFCESFGKKMSRELWTWKFLRNPLNSADVELVVALDNDKVVGARPFMLAEMWLGNEKLKAAQHCDTMVHPQYQGMGIFNRMGKFAIQYLRDNGFTLSYGFPGPLSRPGFLSQGYRIVAKTETLFRVVNPRRVISCQLRNRLLGSGIGFLYDKLLNFKRKDTSSISSIFQLDTFDKVTDELKQVDDLRGESVIDLVRDESYLRWRFDCQPIYSNKYILARRDNRLWGYAVVSVREEVSGLRSGMVVDHLVRNSDIACYRALINHCLCELEKQECDIAVIWTPGEPELREVLLQHFDFKSSVRFPYDRFFAPSYMDVLLLDEQRGERVSIYDEENWRITHAFPDTT
jgi:GNAT superfamily N-acetyltransferase